MRTLFLVFFCFKALSQTIPVGFDEIFLGNTGVTLKGSPGAAHYNPAGLAYQKKDVRFSVSGNLLELSRSKLKVPDAQTQQDIAMKPSMAMSTLSYGKFQVAFGALTPARSNAALLLQTPEVELQFDLKIDATEIPLSIAYGTEDYAIGLTLAYLTVSANVNQFVFRPGSEFQFVGQHQVETNESLLLRLGALYTLSQTTLGLTVELPSLSLSNSTNGYQAFVSPDSASSSSVIKRSEVKPDFQTRLGLRLGLSRESHAGRWNLEVTGRPEGPQQQTPGRFLTASPDSAFGIGGGFTRNLENDSTLLTGLYHEKTFGTSASETYYLSGGLSQKSGDSQRLVGVFLSQLNSGSVSEFRFGLALATSIRFL